MFQQALFVFFGAVIIVCVQDDLSGDKLRVFLTRQKTACLFASNFIRRRYGLKLLKWSDELALGAEDWAIRLALTLKMEHANVEILADIYATYLFSGKFSVPCHNALYFWYKDFELVDSNTTEPETAETYYALLHPTTERVGFGIAFAKKKVYVVARFEPWFNSLDDLKNMTIHEIKRPAEMSSKKLPVKPIVIPVHDVTGWTQWIGTSSCSVSKGQTVQERWCVNIQNQSNCGDGERKRTTPCASPNKRIKIVY